MRIKCTSQISGWNTAVMTKLTAFEANNQTDIIFFIWVILQHCCSTCTEIVLPSCPIPNPSVSIQTSKSCSFWSDNILGDILDIFLRIFAPLGISCTKWRHKIVITKIIIDHKLISKVVFTATSFPVLEDHLWPFPFPISPTLSLLPHGAAIHLLSWKMHDGPFWCWVWYSNLCF